MIISSSCTTDEVTVYKTNKLRYNSQAQIQIDSTEIFRNNRDNSLNVELRYQANLFNATYDSIKWEFPGGTPNQITNVNEIAVSYEEYGVYDAKMIILKYDTLNYGKVRLLVDSVSLKEKIKIKFKETNWASYETNTSWSTIGSNITYLDVNKVYENNNPSEIKTTFSGFQDKYIRLKFDFKVVLNNPLSTTNYTNNQKKIQIKIDDFTKFISNKIKDDTYYSVNINHLVKNDFELNFEVFPPLISSDWNIVNNNNNSPLYSYVTKNENFLIGYTDFSTTSSVTIGLNDLSYGSNDKKNLKLSDSSKIIFPMGENKIMIKLDDGLPKSFQIFNKGSNLTGTSLESNEYYYKIFIKNLTIEILPNLNF